MNKLYIFIIIIVGKNKEKKVHALLFSSYFKKCINCKLLAAIFVAYSLLTNYM